ncbi:hypothetical protein [Wolbachia endosymbiont of Pentidionis agamae]|uniref:hypothetical protein n=1 Tax=Wolbachia endosymbiont of Pentidionis agamae TaxID=3110435 RepID=UPI002FD10745
MIKLGIDPFIKNRNGKTCFDLFRERIAQYSKDSSQYAHIIKVFSIIDRDLSLYKGDLDRLGEIVRKYECISEAFIRKIEDEFENIYELHVFFMNDSELENAMISKDSIRKVHKKLENEYANNYGGQYYYLSKNNDKERCYLDELCNGIYQKLDNETSQISLPKLKEVVKNIEREKLAEIKRLCVNIGKKEYDKLLQERISNPNSKLEMPTLKQLSLKTIATSLI